MHFARAAAAGTTAPAIAAAAVTAGSTAAGTALRLAGGAAFRTTIRLVLKAFAREELLFSGAKNKLAVAINAV
jgi:hypothetical protein